MDKQQLKDICELLIDKKPPLKVVNLAHMFLVQSKPKIILKGPAEHARAYVCCVLAIQELQDQLDLEYELNKPPIPQRQVQNMVRQFEKQLLEDEGMGDDDDEFMASPARSPSKSPRKSPSKPSTPRKLKRNEMEFKANMTRIKRHRADDEQDEFKLFERLQKKLELPLDLIKSMASIHQQYKEHVTDNWGLAMAIAHTMVHRICPEHNIGLERTILQSSRCGEAEDRLSAMLPWVHTVLNSQPEVAQAAQVPEHINKFYGGTGGWELQLEPEYWWEEDTPMAAATDV